MSTCNVFLGTPNTLPHIQKIVSSLQSECVKSGKQDANLFHKFEKI